MCIVSYAILFYLAIQTKFIDTNALHHKSTSIYRNTYFRSKRLEPQIYKKTAELLTLIDNVYKSEKGTRFFVRTNQELPIKYRNIIEREPDASSYPDTSHDIRSHYISNPEILYKFRGFKMNSLQSSSSSYESSYADENGPERRLKDILKEVRRRSLYRILDESEQIKPKSFENVKDNRKADYVDSQIKIIERNNRYDKIDREPEVYEEDIKNYKGKNDKFETEDTWDVITKKYDWNNDNEQDDYKDNINENLNQKKDNSESEIKKDLEDWQKTDEKRNKKKKDSKSKRDKRIGKNKKDTEEKNNWDVSKREITVKANDWDDWGISKFENSYKDTKKKSIEDRNWVTTKKEWSKNDRKRRTTKKWKPEAVKINKWENYKPRKESKARKEDNGRNFGMFMRTSIPYVGKKAVYDDK